MINILQRHPTKKSPAAVLLDLLICSFHDLFTRRHGLKVVMFSSHRSFEASTSPLSRQTIFCEAATAEQAAMASNFGGHSISLDFTVRTLQTLQLHLTELYSQSVDLSDFTIFLPSHLENVSFHPETAKKNLAFVRVNCEHRFGAHQRRQCRSFRDGISPWEKAKLDTSGIKTLFTLFELIL